MKAEGGGLVRVLDIKVRIRTYLTLSLSTDQREYTMGQEIRISGNVKDPKGKPVESGTVQIELSCGEWSETILGRIVGGVCEVSYFIGSKAPVGDWTLSAEATDARGNSGKLEEPLCLEVKPTTLRLDLLSPTECSFEVGELVTIKVMATYPNGAPVERATLRATLPSGEILDLAYEGEGKYGATFRIGPEDVGSGEARITAFDQEGNRGFVSFSLDVGPVTTTSVSKPWSPIPMLAFIGLGVGVSVIFLRWRRFWSVTKLRMS